MKKYRLMSVLTILMISGLLTAQSPVQEQNEDMKFIRDWVHAQLVADLASQLVLTPEQIATLSETKAAVDGLKAEFEPQRETAVNAMHDTAARVRANIEATDSFSEEDRLALREARLAVREVRHAQREAMHETVSGLRELLTEEQIQVIKDVMQAHRENNRPGDGLGLGRQGKGQGLSQGQGQGQQGRARGNRGGKNRHGQAMIRILLSDQFLSHYQ